MKVDTFLPSSLFLPLRLTLLVMEELVPWEESFWWLWSTQKQELPCIYMSCYFPECFNGARFEVLPLTQRGKCKGSNSSFLFLLFIITSPGFCHLCIHRIVPAVGWVFSLAIWCYWHWEEWVAEEEEEQGPPVLLRSSAFTAPCCFHKAPSLISKMIVEGKSSEKIK